MKSFIMMLIMTALVTGCDSKKVDAVDSSFVVTVVDAADVGVEVAASASASSSVSSVDTGKEHENHGHSDSGK
jgi:hypothetical protein